MRRLGILGLILGLVLTASLVAGVPTRTRAQEVASATPTPAVLFESVADGVTPPLVADQAGVDLELARFEAGASYTVPVDDEGLLLVAVESGVYAVAPLATGDQWGRWMGATLTAEGTLLSHSAWRQRTDELAQCSI